MTTLLSTFVSKIPGLSLSTLDMVFSNNNPRAVLLSTDAAANGDYPYLLLKTAFQNSGSGGAVQIQAKNASAAYVNAGLIRGKLTTLTAGAEVSQIDLTILVAGAAKSVSVLGAGSMSPSANGAFTLGTDALRWGGLYVGDGTVKGDALIASSQFQVGTATAHALALKTNATVRVTIDSAGMITLATAAQRIYSDFWNATHASRTIFMSSTAAKATYVAAAPSAGGVIAGFVAYGNPDPSNSSFLQITNDGAALNTLLSSSVGTGTVYPLRLQVGANDAALSAETNGDIRVGKQGGIAASGTSGFLYITNCAGTPTGVPTSRSGFTPVMYDTSANKIWFYSSGWKGVVVA